MSSTTSQSSDDNLSYESISTIESQKSSSTQPPDMTVLEISTTFDDVKFKSDGYYDEDMVFNPSGDTTNPELFIEVLTQDKILQGAIPCKNKFFLENE